MLAAQEALVRWQEHITVDPEVLAAKPIIKGTRMAVEFVIGLLADGWTVEQVLAEYDQLSAADIRACLSYACEVLADVRVYPVSA